MLEPGVPVAGLSAQHLLDPAAAGGHGKQGLNSVRGSLWRSRVGCCRGCRMPILHEPDLTSGSIRERNTCTLWRVLLIPVIVVVLLVQAGAATTSGRTRAASVCPSTAGVLKG